MTATVPNVTAWPTTYTICALPRDIRDWDLFAITVEETAPDQWAVRRRSRCLSASGEWEVEPTPSERGSDWLALHRFDVDTALRLASAAARTITVNGWTVERALAEWEREQQ